MRRPFILLMLVAALPVPPAGGQATSTPPPTPVPPFGSPSPYPTALETPSPGAGTPRLEAPSAVLVDVDSGQGLFARDADRRRPIASTTKIMTALLVLEAVRPSDAVTTTANAASQGGANLGLLPGETIPVKELLYALLLQSSNDAAVALAEHVSGSVSGFVARMNERVRQLGLADTWFASPNGLDDRGYSTARELATITVEAYRKPTFEEVVATRLRTIPSPVGEARRLQNRNALLWLFPGAIGVKTGYTAAAGSCLVAAAERDGLRLATVVLGIRGEAFSDAATLLNYGFAAFEHRTLVRPRERFDPVRVGGRTVKVAADQRVRVLLRREARITRTVRLEPGLSLPLARGEQVGEVVVLADGQEVGRSPLVTLEGKRPKPATTSARPWWTRALEAVVSFLSGLFRTIFE